MSDQNGDERQDEVQALSAIFEDFRVDPKHPFVAHIDIRVAPNEPVATQVKPSLQQPDVVEPQPAPTPPTVKLSYFPSLHLKLTLPDQYPAECPPLIELSTSLPWIPNSTLRDLERQGRDLWNSNGRLAVGFDFISLLEETAQDFFGLGNTLSVTEKLQAALVEYDKDAKRQVFERSSFKCGVCLEFRSGKDCFELSCGDVFCRACLQAFFTSAITEGDTSNVVCPAFDCKAVEPASNSKRTSKSAQTLRPSELLQIPLDIEIVKRYVEIKRKKRIEADLEKTIYCPRQWCQGFVRSAKYPPINDLDDIVAYDKIASEPIDQNPTDTASKLPTTKAPNDSEDARLVICESCKFAFCRTCLRGWHGSFVNCRPRNASELTEDEQQSYNYISSHTSPCAYCSAPTSKTHGCNHMTCSMCKTHFCYLCGAYLDPGSPYKHFNTQGTPCFGRLWEGEEGDGEGRREGPVGNEEEEDWEGF